MALDKSLVQFGYGYNEATSKVAGMLSFDASAQAIYVGDGEKANLVSSSVKDVTFASGVLTIKKINGDVHTLNFTDVASAKETMAVFNALDTRVTANATAVGNLETSISKLDASYKAADASLSDRISTLEGLVGEGGDVDERIADAIADADASIRKDFADADASIRKDFAAADASINEELAEVKATAEAAQTAEEVESAITAKINALSGSKSGSDASNFVTVTVNTSKGEVSSVSVVGSDIASAAELTRVAGRVDTFLDSKEVAGVVDTLHEINEWMNTTGANATDLSQAIAEEAATRKSADDALGLRIDGVKATAEAAATKIDFNAYVSSNDSALAGVAATANAAAVKTSVDTSLNLKADKTQVATDISTAKSEAISAASSDATSKANTAESNAKAYADKIKVNGVSQSSQEITISGVNIKVGGTGTHSTNNIDVVVEDLYTKVQNATDNAGVISFAIKNNSSNYASVDASKGNITFEIKKVAIADATESNTGVADAYDVKTSISSAKSEVVGTSADASTAATVYGAKKMATELNSAMDERMAVVEGQLKWNVLS